jgi:hypothetical protein
MLAALGITAIELMPVAQFPGQRNWGYDGVFPYAPAHAYGGPAALRAFIEAAHDAGLSVLLDVVYNHFGPQGNHLRDYARGFFRDDRSTPWGEAIDFRQPWVRRFFIDNALMWLRDYGFDGLRLDAVHAIDDDRFLQQLADEVRAVAPHAHLVLENERNQARWLRGAYQGQWNDDFHNALHVMLTGEQEGYYAAYAGRAEALLARCLAEGFAWQGEPDLRGDPRGEPSADLSPARFVVFAQNHDQVGNRAFGERLSMLTDPAPLRAALALTLLTPMIPLLFMGEPWQAQSPFLFFTDYAPPLDEAVREGRRREFAVSAPLPTPPRARVFRTRTMRRPCRRRTRRRPAMIPGRSTGCAARVSSSACAGAICSRACCRRGRWRARAGPRRGAGGLAVAIGPMVDRDQRGPCAGGACGAGRRVRRGAGRCRDAAGRRRRACLLDRRMNTDAAVRETARRAGLLVRWTDVAGAAREVAPDVLRAVLEGCSARRCPSTLACARPAADSCWRCRRQPARRAGWMSRAQRCPPVPMRRGAGACRTSRVTGSGAGATSNRRLRWRHSVPGGRGARCAAGACRRRSTACARPVMPASVTAPAVHDGASCCTVTAATHWR